MSAAQKQERPSLMISETQPDGTTITVRRPVRCGLKADHVVKHAWTTHEPGRRGALLHMETAAGVQTFDLDFESVMDLIHELARSQVQCWQNNGFPTDLREGEYTTPPKMFGRVETRNTGQRGRRK